MKKQSLIVLLVFFSFQSSLCAARRPSSAGVACARAPPQVVAIPGAQTHAGLQECAGTNRQVSRSWRPWYIWMDYIVTYCKLYSCCVLITSSDFMSFQCAHLHLHDRCQLAIHTANHLSAHLWLHRANSVAIEAPNRGRWGDPKPRDWREWGGSTGRENTSNQAAQNWWVGTPFPASNICHFLFIIKALF